MPINDTATYYSIKQVAEILNVAEMTVYQQVWAGNIPAIKVGRIIRIPAEALSYKALANNGK